jgi:hypothetical protein
MKWKWGLLADALLEEAIDRQRLFIEAQHPADIMMQSELPDHRTLALRCIRDPSQPDLVLVLIAKVCAFDPDSAGVAALHYWEKLKALLPYDYVYKPVASRAEFSRLSGCEVLNKALESADCPVGCLVEIGRFEEVLTDSSIAVYLLGKWQSSGLGNEQVWRALAGCSVPIMLNITLRPTVFLDQERLALLDMRQAMERVAQSSAGALFPLEIELAAQVHRERLSGLRYPFLMQVHLIAVSEVPEYIPCAVATAFTHYEKGKTLPVGYRVLKAATSNRVASHLHDLLLLEPILINNTLADPRFSRLRYMVDALEACAAFRFPFPPDGGIPGVSFAQPGNDLPAECSKPLV